MLKITRCRNGIINDDAAALVLFALLFVLLLLLLLPFSVVFDEFWDASIRCSVVSQGG